MAIDKRLLDDIAPSEAAVERLKNRPRRIKPWESDRLLQSTNESGDEHHPSVPGVNGSTVPELPSHSGPATKNVPSPDPERDTKSELTSDSVLGPKLGLSSTSDSSTNMVASTDMVPATESVRESPTGASTTHVEARESPQLPQQQISKLVPTTESVLTSDLAVSTKSDPRPCSVLPDKVALSAELECDTEGGKLAQLGNLDVAPSTATEVTTEEGSSHNPVPNTHSVPKNQVGTQPNNERQPSASVSRRPQPYAVSDYSENFTRVPHAVTEALQREDFTSRQLRLLITILRETIGWGREFAELSAKDFAKKTGIAASHIFITLRDLENQGAIIRKLNGKNAKNSYALNKTFFGKHSPRRTVPNGAPPSTGSVPDTECELTANSVLEASSDPVRSTQHETGAIESEVNNRNYQAISSGKKDSKKAYRNSLSEIPESVESLLARIRPANKRESERDCALQLLSEYSPADLVAAVEYLGKNGILGTGEPVHSPFRYLMSAAEQVLAQVSKGKEKNSQLPSVQPQKSEPSEKYEEALPLFENQLSDDAKQQYIARYIELELSHGFLPPQGILRKLAALKWYTEQRNARGGTVQLAVAR